MEKFSNWVEKRDEVGVCEGLAHELVRLNIDPQKFSEWVLEVARRGELNKVDLNEGMFDYLRGLGGAIKQSGVNWHQQAQNYAKQQQHIALAKNAQSILDKLKYDLLELGIGRKEDKHRNDIKNAFAYFQQRLGSIASQASQPIKKVAPAQPVVAATDPKFAPMSISDKKTPLTMNRYRRYGGEVPSKKKIIPDDVDLAPENS